MTNACSYGKFMYYSNIFSIQLWLTFLWSNSSEYFFKCAIYRQESLFSLKKEGMLTCVKHGKNLRNSAKWNKTVTQNTNIVWLYLHEVPRVVRITETESRMVVTRGWGEERKQSCLMGTEFQFCKMKILWKLLNNKMNVFYSAELHV